MSAHRDDLTQDDPRILQASREYLAELEAGNKPDRQSYLTQFPELAGQLSECFDGIDLAQSLRPPVPIPQSQPEFTATPLGDFQILNEIGRGGMGVVYEAIQLSLGRRVALKVLPFAAAIDAKQLQRFKNEATAAAQLHHTNIVPVYAVGCERGVHFYAMQLIEGRSLSALIRELRGDSPNDPSSSALATTAAYHASVTIAKSYATSGTQHSGAAARAFGHPLASRHKWPTRRSTLTRPGSCIATSSPPTCCSMPREPSGSRTSAWPKSSPMSV